MRVSLSPRGRSNRRSSDFDATGDDIHVMKLFNVFLNQGEVPKLSRECLSTTCPQSPNG